MPKNRTVKKAQTVLGLVTAEELGVTLPHEHLLIDGRCNFIEPVAASDRFMAYKPVSMETLHWLRYHPFENLDNCRMMDEQEAIDEVMAFKKARGSTVVDVTNCGAGRDPLGLTRISRATGLNIIMGASYYVYPAHPAALKTKNEEEIVEEIVRDLTVGVGNSDVRAGLIGEVGQSWPMYDTEIKVIRASAKAQRKTNAPINIHLGRKADAAFAVLKLLDEAGADLSRVVLSHIDIRVRDHTKRVELAKMGCYLEFDTFGWEGQFPVSIYYEHDLFYQPNDTQRIREIMQLIEAGFIKQILISQDVWVKTWRARYGGKGYDHVSCDVVPRMRTAGMSQKEIDTIMVENPARLFCFVEE